MAGEARKENEFGGFMVLRFGAGVMDPAWLEFPAQTKDFFFFPACSYVRQN